MKQKQLHLHFRVSKRILRPSSMVGGVMELEEAELGKLFAVAASSEWITRITMCWSSRGGFV